MSGQPDVINVHFRVTGYRHHDGPVPEAPVIDAVRALCYGKKRFDVEALRPYCQAVFAVMLYCAGVEGGVDAKACHKMGIAAVIKVIPPEHRRMIACDYRMEVPVEDSVAAFHLNIGPADEFFMIIKKALYPVIEFLFCHCFRFFRNKYNG